MTLIGIVSEIHILGADLVLVSLISGGVVCSARVVMLQVYSAWQCQRFFVGCYLTNVSISLIKYTGFKMSGSHVCVGWLLCWAHTTEIRERLLPAGLPRTNISPRPFLILLSDLLKHFRGAIVWLLPSLCPYCSSLLVFALFHPMISGFYLPFCMNVLFLLIYWKAFLSCSLKSSGGVGLGLDWTQSTFQLPGF